MSNDYTNLLAEVQDRVNRQRQMERLIGRTDFMEAYERSVPEARKSVEDMIVKCDRNGVMRWISEQLTREYGECSLRQLRRIGQRLRVKHYNNLPKDILLSEIVNAENRKAGEEGPSNGSYEQHHAEALANA